MNRKQQELYDRFLERREGVKALKRELQKLQQAFTDAKFELYLEEVKFFEENGFVRDLETGPNCWVHPTEVCENGVLQGSTTYTLEETGLPY